MWADQQPHLAALAASVSLHAEYVDGEDQIVFQTEVTAVPQALLGVRMRLSLGPVTVMTFTLPTEAPSRPLLFGPTTLDHKGVVLLRSHLLTLRPDGAPDVAAVPVPGGTGAAMEAMTLPDDRTFFERVQLHHRRFTDPRLLVLGARASFPRLTSFDARCAALTVVAHRLLEADPGKPPSELASALGDWVLTEGRLLVQEGAAKLAAAEKPGWTDVRWTVSLATVCALLCLIRDDLEGAHGHFGIAAEQTHLVGISHVSALNLVNACLFKGLLLAMDSRMDEARVILERGVKAYPPCVAAQNVMLNVWVIGDLINVAKASRMCFVALGRLNLLDPSPSPRMDERAILDLWGVQSPVARILAAGRAPRLEAFVDSVSGMSSQAAIS